MAALSIRGPSSFPLFALPFTVIWKVTLYSKKATGTPATTPVLQIAERKKGKKGPAHSLQWSYFTLQLVNHDLVPLPTLNHSRGQATISKCGNNAHLQNWDSWASLVASSSRIHLPVQWKWVPFLSRKIPYAAGQLSPCTTTTEAAVWILREASAEPTHPRACFSQETTTMRSPHTTN